jgi:hypothetical protein
MDRLPFSLLLLSMERHQVPSLGETGGERRLAPAADEVVDGGVLHVSRLAPWVHVSMLFLLEPRLSLPIHFSLELSGYTGAIRTWLSDSRTKVIT